MNQPSSTWFALRNPVYLRLWAATLLSGMCVSAHDIAATWALNSLGASPLVLSLLAAAGSLPFFLFTLPAGALADIASRRAIMLAMTVWQAVCALILGALALTGALSAEAILGLIFLLGVGFAVAAPVWGALLPEVVTNEELPSAVTLSGVQLNLSGVIGPALGGALLPIVGAASLFLLNGFAFLLVTLAFLFWKSQKRAQSAIRENFLESFVTALRYLGHSTRMRVLVVRNILFAAVISLVPALVPVMALKVLGFAAGELGLLFTAMAIGALGGAIFVLPELRKRFGPNLIVTIAFGLVILGYAVTALLPPKWLFILVAAVVGIAWTLAGSELWVAGQRVMPEWARGRMNAFLIMLAQGITALGAIVWGSLANSLPAASAMWIATGVALAVGAISHLLSIDFTRETAMGAATVPFHEPLGKIPSLREGPVAVTYEFEIDSADRNRFLELMKEVQATFRRNGAFASRLEESLDRPGRFRLDSHFSSWAERLRLLSRITVEEHETWNNAWALHLGSNKADARHYVAGERAPQVCTFGFIGRACHAQTSMKEQLRLTNPEETEALQPQSAAG